MSFSKNPSGSDLRMGGNQGKPIGGGKSLGQADLPKASNNPQFKPAPQKGIMSKGGSLGAGQDAYPNRGGLKGFQHGGVVKP